MARFISQETAVNTPITEMVVNSLITSHADGASVQAGTVTVGGIAWDGGYGIRAVEVSTDGGKSWKEATLGQDLGRFAFRAVQLRGAGAARQARRDGARHATRSARPRRRR